MNARVDVEKHNEVQRRYYGGAVKRRMLPSDSPYINRQLDRLLAFGGVGPADRVLEIGCGMGRYTLPLLKRGIRVEGIDLSPVLLDRLRSVAGDDAADLTLYCADVIEHPPELTGRFDAVIGFFMLHHVHRLDLLFRAVRALLAPGGRALFLEPNAYCALYYIQILSMPDMTWEGDKGVVKMRRRPIFRAFESAGLRRPVMERFGFFPPFVANRPWAQPLETALVLFPLWRPFLPFQLFKAERD